MWQEEKGAEFSEVQVATGRHFISQVCSIFRDSTGLGSWSAFSSLLSWLSLKQEGGEDFYIMYFICKRLK